MSSLFSGGAAAQAMKQPISAPRPQRMPVDGDASVLEAAKRRRKAAAGRTGRLSTIMTDNTSDTVGSSGRSLGA